MSSCNATHLVGYQAYAYLEWFLRFLVKFGPKAKNIKMARYVPCFSKLHEKPYYYFNLARRVWEGSGSREPGLGDCYYLICLYDIYES